MAPIIRMVGLTKRFGGFTAVDRLDLEVEEGEILGLLGPNGAGKTTTILMLATVLKPTEGTVYIGPYDVTKEADKARRLVGVAFQEPKLLWVDSPWSVLNWHAKVCGLPSGERRRRIRWVLEELGIWDVRFKSAHSLSGGTRKRVEVAKILVQRPKIAIFDEPTAQVDVVGKHKIWGMIRELRDEGSTIILATNELHEADVLSQRIAIMHRGKLLVCDEPRRLKDSIPGGDVVEVSFEGGVPEMVTEELRRIPTVVEVSAARQNQVKIYLNRAEEALPRIAELLLRLGLQAKSMRVSEPSLDDVFAHYTGLTIEEAQRR
ncbi:MAG: ATP-binding cassette domain-containing protein [Candidatus Nezhaarchaeota archaeon]|nr:ATP-binding cassette domain-containing protein [Candidatus Nezhaarchaeota archaeon]